MTANTPPTPPAARDRKLESVFFEAWTSSSLTSPVEGIEGVEEEDEEDDITIRIGRITNSRKKVRDCDVDLVKAAELSLGRGCLFSALRTRSGRPTLTGIRAPTLPYASLKHTLREGSVPEYHFHPKPCHVRTVNGRDEYQTEKNTTGASISKVMIRVNQPCHR